MCETMTKSGRSILGARKIVLCFLLILIPLTFSVQESSALTAPWYRYYYALYYSVGKTPGVIVQEPYQNANDTWTIDVVVENQEKREALATLLKPHPEGDEPPYTLIIRVVDGNGILQAPLPIIGTPGQQLAELENLVLIAFRQNPEFFKVEIVNDPVNEDYLVFIIFKAKMVQFYTQDISDYYWRSTYVVTDLFRTVLIGANPYITPEGMAFILINPSTKEFHSP